MIYPLVQNKHISFEDPCHLIYFLTRLINYQFPNQYHKKQIKKTEQMIEYDYEGLINDLASINL